MHATRDRMGAVAVPAWIWLVVLVVGSTALRAGLAMSMRMPWILPDEIVYSELAKSLAGEGRLAIRDVTNVEWGPIYPLLIAPGWLLFDDPARAHRVAFAVNAFVMSLAAVPAYLLARMFVKSRSALLVAVFALLVPSMAYTNVVMTENAFYPAFLLSVLAIARCVEQPTVARQAMVFGSILLTLLVRFQGSALLGAYAGAAILYAALLPSGGRGAYIRRYLPSGLVAVCVTLVPTVLSVVRGDGVVGWLGQYGDSFVSFNPSEIPKWFMLLAAELTLYVAVAPVAAVAVLALHALSEDADERLRLFVSVVLGTCAALLVAIAIVSAAWDVDGEENLNERYVFYLIPLTLLGLALWVERGMPRPRPAIWFVLAACCFLPAFIPINDLEYNARFQSVGLWLWLLLPLPGLPLACVVLSFTAGAGLLWARVRRERIGRVWLLVGVMFALTGAASVYGMYLAANLRAAPGQTQGLRWIDDTVGPTASIPVLWDERGAQTVGPEPNYRTVMLAEFFNRSVGTVYRLGPETHYDPWLLTRQLRLTTGGVLRDPAGRAPTPPYILAPSVVGVVGDAVAHDPIGDLVLYRVHGPLRVVRNAGLQDS